MQIDYFYSLRSPWTYLGHARLIEIARAYGATVRCRPVRLRDVVAAAGGKPLAEQSPARQAHRDADLERMARWLGMPIHVHPAHHVGPVDPPSCAVIAAGPQSEAAAALSGAILTALWRDDRDVGAPAVLAELRRDVGLPDDPAAVTPSPETLAVLEENTAEAVRRGLIGSPSYVFGEHQLWGQDRLPVLEWLLSGAERRASVEPAA